jgi:hypothetical protein
MPWSKHGLLVYWLWPSHLEWDSTNNGYMMVYEPQKLGDDHQAMGQKRGSPGFHCNKWMLIPSYYGNKGFDPHLYSTIPHQFHCHMEYPYVSTL